MATSVLALEFRVVGNTTSIAQVNQFKSAITRAADEINQRWLTPLNNLERGIDSVARKAEGVFKTGLTAAVGAIGALSYAMTGLGRSFVEVNQKFSEFEITLASSLKSLSSARRIVDEVAKITATSPIAFKDLAESVTGLTVLPQLNSQFQRQARGGTLGDEQGLLRKSIQLVEMMTTFRPDKRPDEAVFSIREALTGEFRSLQRRFDVPLSILTEASGKSIAELKKLGPNAILDAMSKAFGNIITPEALKQRAQLPSVAIENLFEQIFQQPSLSVGRAGVMDVLVKKLDTYLQAASNFFTNRSDDPNSGGFEKGGFADRTSLALSKAFENVTKKLEQIADQALTGLGFGGSGSILERAAEAVTTGFEVLAEKLPSIIDTIVDYGTRFVKLIKDFISVLAGVGRAFLSITENLSPFQTAMVAAFGPTALRVVATTAASSLIGTLRDALTDSFKSRGSQIFSALDFLKDLAKNRPVSGRGSNSIHLDSDTMAALATMGVTPTFKNGKKAGLGQNVSADYLSEATSTAAVAGATRGAALRTLGAGALIAGGVAVDVVLVQKAMSEYGKMLEANNEALVTASKTIETFSKIGTEAYQRLYAVSNAEGRATLSSAKNNQSIVDSNLSKFLEASDALRDITSRLFGNSLAEKQRAESFQKVVETLSKANPNFSAVGSPESGYSKVTYKGETYNLTLGNTEVIVGMLSKAALDLVLEAQKSVNRSGNGNTAIGRFMEGELKSMLEATGTSEDMRNRYGYGSAYPVAQGPSLFAGNAEVSAIIQQTVKQYNDESTFSKARESTNQEFARRFKEVDDSIAEMVKLQEETLRNPLGGAKAQLYADLGMIQNRIDSGQTTMEVGGKNINLLERRNEIEQQLFKVNSELANQIAMLNQKRDGLFAEGVQGNLMLNQAELSRFTGGGLAGGAAQNLEAREIRERLMRDAEQLTPIASALKESALRSLEYRQKAAEVDSEYAVGLEKYNLEIARAELSVKAYTEDVQAATLAMKLGAEVGANKVESERRLAAATDSLTKVIRAREQFLKQGSLNESYENSVFEGRRMAEGQQMGYRYSTDAVRANREQRALSRNSGAVGSFGDGFSSQFAMGDDFKSYADTGIAAANAIKGGFQNAFASIADGTMTVKNAFRSMAVAILQEIARIMAAKAAAQIITLAFNAVAGAWGSGGGTTSNGGAGPASYGTGGSGVTMYAADGGPVIGGSGYRDDVPAMLMGGEFVLNKKATAAIGVENLKRFNDGDYAKMAAGGYVGNYSSTTTNVPTVTSSNNAPTFNTTVNFESSGGSNDEPTEQETRELNRQLEATIYQTCEKWDRQRRLSRQSRPA